MKAKDIQFECIYDECPEQYEANDAAGNLVGYVRIRYGFCEAWCPDTGSDDKVYSRKICGGWSFGNALERWIHLHRISKAIARWWNGRR